MRARTYIGMGIGLGVLGTIWLQDSHWFNREVMMLKRKLRKIERRMHYTFDNLDKETLKSYQTKVMDKFQEIKYKIDNISVKDIKEKSTETFSTIKENLEHFAQGLNELASSS